MTMETPVTIAGDIPAPGISAPRRGDLLLTGAYAFAAGTQQFLHKANPSVAAKILWQSSHYSDFYSY